MNKNKSVKMTEEQINQELENSEQVVMQCLNDVLKQYNVKTTKYLADFVASLCDVDRDKMFTECNNIDVVQARGLYWYARRYMTGDTYEKIGKTPTDGKTFTKVGVATSVNKMAHLIESQPIWKKRWNVIKRVIKLQNGMVTEPQVPITITFPKNVELTIKKE